ncbi:hypothetical protein SDC9_210486 [bioreactor metagenome]|uniref:Uncharacterized protein n=1 Tax=bioreactor metagenome TaxID=1076179 RepID=A0A645JTZ4_9ZZZZ
MDESADGTRSYKIIKKEPDGKSHARDIAMKYGIERKNIVDRIKHNGV